MILDDLLAESAALHSHLCPRQVLGVRIGLLAGKLLGLELPRRDKRLLVIAETDGCAVDGISVATGCWVGRRTLRIEDFGKVAATFADTRTECCLRIAPQPRARNLAASYAPEAASPWEAQLLGYQRMADAALLSWCRVAMRESIAAIVSRPGLRVVCQGCGEEIMNGREVRSGGRVLCHACAGQAYYRVLTEDDRAVDDSAPPARGPVETDVPGECCSERAG